jgi:2-polyprenyl-6-methoxyphenol hydroxylase-like FAD-dependent oxidoreductase
LEIFQEIGLVQKALARGAITTAANIFYKGKRRATVDLSGLGQGLSSYPYALSLEQSKTESLLYDYLKENGKAVQWQSEFTHLEQTDSGVKTWYKDAKGVEQVIESEFAVGCDGASSLVRHQLDLSFEGDTVPKIFYVADVLLKSSVINKNELFIFLIKKGFVLFFPMEGEEHYRVVGILPDAKEDQEFKFEDIEGFIKEQIVSPVEFTELKWFSSYKVYSRRANVFANGRCYITGDAAHIHTPAGGQGMNTGIQDAYNLAWKLAYFMRGELNAEALQSYSTERVENASHLLHTTDKMFDLMAGKSGFWNFVRLNILPTLAGIATKNSIIKGQFFPLISQTGIAYPHSALTVPGSIGKVKAGDRMHHFTFPDGTSIFDRLNKPSFKVLYFGDSDKDFSKQTATLKIKVEALSFVEVPQSLFGAETNFYILLRPDNHISYIGKDFSTCRSFLEKISRPSW